MTLEIPVGIKPWLNFIHPLWMWIVLGTSLYALYLGIQVQRTRTARGEIKKELAKGRFNVRHYQVGSVLLALMVVGTLIGMGATYINNQKLFFGPHLLAGLGMTGLIAVSAALSPYMQKGLDWARYTHIALNVGLLGLFGWQAVSGMQIVQKLISEL
jgi:flagellar biosynthesis protein FliQ